MIGSTLSRLGCVIIGHVYPVGSALAAAAPRARALVAAPVRDVCCAPSVQKFSIHGPRARHRHHPRTPPPPPPRAAANAAVRGPASRVRARASLPVARPAGAPPPGPLRGAALCVPRAHSAGGSACPDRAACRLAVRACAPTRGTACASYAGVQDVQVVQALRRPERARRRAARRPAPNFVLLGSDGVPALAPQRRCSASRRPACCLPHCAASCPALFPPSALPAPPRPPRVDGRRAAGCLRLRSAFWTFSCPGSPSTSRQRLFFCCGWCTPTLRAPSSCMKTLWTRCFRSTRLTSTTVSQCARPRCTRAAFCVRARLQTWHACVRLAGAKQCPQGVFQFCSSVPSVLGCNGNGCGA